MLWVGTVGTNLMYCMYTRIFWSTFAYATHNPGLHATSRSTVVEKAVSARKYLSLSVAVVSHSSLMIKAVPVTGARPAVVQDDAELERSYSPQGEKTPTHRRKFKSSFVDGTFRF